MQTALLAAALLLLLPASCDASDPTDPPPAGGRSALVEQLYRLHELHEAGGLSDSEFAAAKRALLGTDEPDVPSAAPVPPHGAPSTMPNLQPFGDAISFNKTGLPTQEVVAYAYTVPATASHAVITHWFSVPFDETAVYSTRFYVDGEATPSLDLDGYEMSCLPQNDTRDAPFGNSLFGKGAHGHGMYNNIRIPFQRSIRVTVMSFKQQSYAFHIRGLLDYPIKIAGLPTPLPPQARLKAYVSHVERQPLEYHPVANITGKEGFVCKRLDAASCLCESFGNLSRSQ